MLMNTRTTKRVLVTALITLTSLATSNAWAQDCTQNVEDLAAQGAEYFRSNRYLEAAEVLQQAYNCEAVPVLLYNIARAYQQADRCVPASQFFRQYLNSGDTQALSQAEEHEPGQTECAEAYDSALTAAENAINSGQLPEAEQLIAEARESSDEPEARMLYADVLYHLSRCQDAITFLNAQVIEASDVEERIKQEARSDLVRAEQCVDATGCQEARAACEETKRQNEEALEAAGASQRTLGLVITGVGGAVLLGAIIHDAAGGGTIDDYEAAAAAGDEDEFNSLREDLDSAKTLSFILYGVGIAGVAAGLVVYLTAGGASDDTTDCTGVCWDWGIGNPGGADAGVWLGGQF